MYFRQACVHGIIVRLLIVLTARPLSELRRHISSEPSECTGVDGSDFVSSTQHVHQHAYRLHALVISRSPFLAHMMSTTPQPAGQCHIYLNLEQEPEVTEEVRCLKIWQLLRR